MVVLLDTGILLRLFDRTDPHHHEVRRALRTLHARGHRLATTPQNLAEFWNACTRPATSRGGYGLTVAESARRLRMIERLYSIIPETNASFPIWKNLVTIHSVQGVKTHDARLVALLMAHGLNDILTLNKADFSRYPGINVMTPASVSP